MCVCDSDEIEFLKLAGSHQHDTRLPREDRREASVYGPHTQKRLLQCKFLSFQTVMVVVVVVVVIGRGYGA